MYYMHIFLHTFYMYEYLITVFFALALVKCKMCLQFSIIQSFVSLVDVSDAFLCSRKVGDDDYKICSRDCSSSTVWKFCTSLPLTTISGTAEW